MADNSETLRTFIALPLPTEWTLALEEVITELGAAISGGVRWVQPSGIHLTLKFLGSTDATLAPHILDGLRDNLRGAPGRPTLSLSGLGTFPNSRNPRVIWAGVQGDTETLKDMHARTEALATGLGWAPERRPFRPHLTIGRVRDQASASQRRAIADAIATTRVPVLESWQANTVRLYRSELTPRGANYTNLGEVAI